MSEVRFVKETVFAAKPGEHLTRGRIQPIFCDTSIPIPGYMFEACRNAIARSKKRRMKIKLNRSLWKIYFPTGFKYVTTN